MNHKVKIFSDTCSCMSVDQGKQMGVTISPLMITIEGKTYRDTVDLTTNRFYELIEAMIVPTTSQPIVGETAEKYNEVPSDYDIVNIAPAEGLSGTYQGAVLAKDLAHNKDRIHVINSKTICATQYYLVHKAQKLALQGESADSIESQLKESIADSESFMIPVNMKYLQKGGRLTRSAAIILGMLKIKPILTLTEDGNRVDRFGIPARTLKDAIRTVVKHMVKKGLDIRHQIYVCHANAIEGANLAISLIREQFPQIDTEVLVLPPVLGTHAGPGTVVIQYIRK